jgi:hypothetical protein
MSRSQCFGDLTAFFLTNPNFSLLFYLTCETISTVPSLRKYMAYPIYCGHDPLVAWRKSRPGRKRAMAKELLNVNHEVTPERSNFHGRLR